MNSIVKEIYKHSLLSNAFIHTNLMEWLYTLKRHARRFNILNIKYNLYTRDLPNFLEWYLI